MEKNKKNKNQNLKRYGKDKPPLTREEAKRLGRLGGLASVKANRERKRMKEAFPIGLELCADERIALAQKSKNLEDIKLLENVDYLCFEVLKILKNPEVPAETRLRAASFIADRVEGKPIQTTEHKGLEAMNPNIQIINQPIKSSWNEEDNNEGEN